MASQTEQVTIHYRQDIKSEEPEPFENWNEDFLKISDLVLKGKLDDSITSYPLNLMHFAYQDVKKMMKGHSKLFFVDKNNEKAMLVYSGFVSFIYSKNKQNSCIPDQKDNVVQYGPYNSSNFFLEINTYSEESADRFKQLMNFLNR